MTKNETIKLLSLTTANFPGMQEKDLKPTLLLWEKMLVDIPYQLAEMALIKVLTTAKFFPTIAEIREAITEITTPDRPSPMEAWEQVRKAIREYGYYREEQALVSLPPVTRDVVKSLGWKEICLSENPEIIRAQFRQAYEVVSNRQHKEDLLPSGFFQQLEEHRQKLALNEAK